ncbi:MAG: pilus assembly protein PilY, partial [Pedobacter sp.]
YNYTYTLYTCTAWNATTFGTTNTQTCTTAGWGGGVASSGSSTGSLSATTPLWSNQPSVTYSSTNPSSISNNPGNNTNQTIIYRQNQSQIYQTLVNDSGIPKSKSRDTSSNPDIVVDRTANDLNAIYKSPLPAASDRVSCDGQGVYILSDGEPTDNVDTTVMAKALNVDTFSCSDGLTGGTNWDCMSSFAKKLFNGGRIQSDSTTATNPVNVSIQTAFVGFGAALNSLNTTDAINACKLSSRTQADRVGDDKCSPNQTTNAVANPGYGNGGFFPTQSAQGVTDSVIAFINNIGGTPLEPLTTGAISVPVDPLSPNGFQPYGYLRALEPNPASSKLIWLGNLKKYKVLLTGNNAGAFADQNNALIYDSKGGFKTNTKDLWNSTSYSDGGIVSLGGAYSKVPLPALGQNEDLSKLPKQYAFASNPNALRPLFTDIAATGGATLASMSNNNSLLRIPSGPIPTSNVSAYILAQMNPDTGQPTLKDFPLLVKQKLLNYLGYSVPLDTTATALPTSLTTPAAPYLAMGGSVHSFPVQLTYSGTLDANGDLTTTREQAVLYGSMEGGLHIVDAEGKEQMVFVPSELLRDNVSSKALVKGSEDNNAPIAGMDGAWIADPAYKVETSGTNSSVRARQMNVYGGLRMGGNSYYGLNVLDPSDPKLLFRVGSDQTNFSRMGQSWSKPIIANIRYNGAIRRVMIVGGGYDICYESPTFTLASTGDNSSCATKTKALGNAVYIIDAKTGARLWWTSDINADTNNANMKHSVVSRISALDRNGDGLVDHLYFGDLGGQVFRADLNNNQTLTGSTYSSFGVRVVRLANLATDTNGLALTTGKNPRFYEPPTLTIHDQGRNTFILVGVASGNRSTPLDVFPLQGRETLSPTVALTDRLVNNVYGIVDRDFINGALMTIADNSLLTKDKTLSNLQKDPQKLTSGTVINTFL